MTKETMIVTTLVAVGGLVSLIVGWVIVAHTVKQIDTKTKNTTKQKWLIGIGTGLMLMVAPCGAFIGYQENHANHVVSHRKQALVKQKAKLEAQQGQLIDDLKTTQNKPTKFRTDVIKLVTVNHELQTLDHKIKHMKKPF